jgi:hypothetical protein
VIYAGGAEPDAPGHREVVAKIGETIARFAAFLGASEVTYASLVPRMWKSSHCRVGPPLPDGFTG